MKSTVLILLVAITFGLAIQSCPTAQEKSAKPGEQQAILAPDDPKIPIGELKSHCTYMDKEDLGGEKGLVKKWKTLLKEKSREIKLKEILSEGAKGEEKTKAIEALNKLYEERTGLVDRINIVIGALSDKGGDVAEYKKYVDANSGSMAPDVTDPNAAWVAITGWLQSKEGGIRWGKNIGLFLLTLLVFKILGSILGRITGRALAAFKKTSDLLRDFFVNSVRKVTFFVGIIVALSMLEVNIGPFLAAIGAAGFVIGFALQGTLSNFASGIMILLYRPYDIGDAVSVAGVAGKVDAMTLVSTTITSFDNQQIIVPNSSIWGDVITNITGRKRRRVDLVFGIGYEDDIAKAQKILEEIVKSHSLVLDDPAPVVKLHELADSSVNFVVRPWSKTSDYWDVYWDLTRMVKERFDAEGISIPYPQRDVHLIQAAE